MSLWGEFNRLTHALCGGYLTMAEERDGRRKDDKSRRTLLVQLVSLSNRWLTLASEDVAKTNSTLPTQINPNINLRTDRGSDEITLTR